LLIDEINICQAKQRERYAQQLHKLTGEPVTATLAELLRFANEIAQRDMQPKEPAEIDCFAVSRQELAKTPPAIGDAAGRMARNPELLREVYHDLQSLGLVGEPELALTLWLLGTSRLLPQPMAAVVIGASSTGRSFSLNSVAKLFPPESVLKVSDASPTSWFYLPPGSLCHKFVLLGERPQSETPESVDARRAWRELVADGELTKAVTEKTGNGLVARIVHQRGPVAFAESTTKAKLFEEDATRLLILQSDDSEEQSRRVVTRLFGDAARVQDTQHIESVVAKHWAFQRMIGQAPAQVVLPEGMAARLGESLPAFRPECRRLARQVLAMIRASAVAHQFLRGRQGGVVLAEPADYAVAFRLLRGPAAMQLGKEPHKSIKRLFAALRARFAEGEFTTKEATELAGLSERWARQALRWLAENGLAEETEPPKGPRPARWRLVASRLPEGGVLPEPASIELA